MSANTPQWVAAYFAIAMLGAVTVPVNPRFSAREIRYVLRKSRCRLLLAQKGLAATHLGAQTGEADDIAPDMPLGACEFGEAGDPFSGIAAADPGFRPGPVEPESTAVIMFTSGSTAFPKGCMLSHLGLARNAFLHDARLHLSPDDRWFGPLPFFHASGCVWGILSTVCVGATLISCEGFDTEMSLRLLQDERCTYQHGIDTIYVRQLEMMKHSRFDISRLKKSTSTGPLSLLARIREELGVEFIMSKWGATEGHGNLSLCDVDDPVERRIGSHGRLYSEFAYRIADPERPTDTLPPHGEGEIQVRGASMHGYFDDPEATRAVFLPGGWLRTGDLGRLEGDFLYYTGRIKDMLKVGGENIAATEIEAALIRHPDVRNAAVIAVTDTEWGQIPVAFVEPVAGRRPDEAELLAHCQRLLSRIKVPRRVIVVDEFPRTGSGKVDKKRLAVN